MNTFTKIVWYVIAVALLLIVLGYIFDRSGELRGLAEFLLAIPTTLLLIFNLAYTNHQWNKKSDSNLAKPKSDIVGVALVTIISLILASCLYIFLKVIFKF